jgi:hypothetical protein
MDKAIHPQQGPVSAAWILLASHYVNKERWFNRFSPPIVHIQREVSAIRTDLQE